MKSTRILPVLIALLLCLCAAAAAETTTVMMYMCGTDIQSDCLRDMQ